MVFLLLFPIQTNGLTTIFKLIQLNVMILKSFFVRVRRKFLCFVLFSFFNALFSHTLTNMIRTFSQPKRQSTKMMDLIVKSIWTLMSLIIIVVGAIITRKTKRKKMSRIFFSFSMIKTLRTK